MNPLAYLLILAIMIILFIIIFLDRIRAFLKPEDWFYAWVLKNNNSLEEKLMKKPEGNSFKIKEHVYMMNDDIPYKRKRLQAWIYNEGQKDPLDLRRQKLVENTQIFKKFTEISIADLFKEDNPLNNFLNNNSTIIFLIIGGIVIFLLWKNSGG